MHLDMLKASYLGLQFFHIWLLKTFKYNTISPLQPTVMFKIIILGQGDNDDQKGGLLRVDN